MAEIEGGGLEQEAAAVRAARDVYADPEYGSVAHRPLVRLCDQVLIGKDGEECRVVVCPHCGADRDFGLSYSNRLYCRCGRHFTDAGMDPSISRRIVDRYLVRGEPVRGGVAGRAVPGRRAEIRENGEWLP